MYRIVIGTVAAVVLLAGCRDRSETNLNGTGSTFVHPIMDKWAAEYQKVKRGHVTYEAIGSSIGMQRLASGTFDFACTDAPVTDVQLAALKNGGGDVAYVPLVLGAVAPAYNLPGFKEPLIFSGPVLADVFLGKVTRWNDNAIQALNSGITLPDVAIVVVHRSDGSGTTYVWTDYLSKTSTDWQAKVGSGTSVKWPAGIGRAANSGVVDSIKSTLGAIGYVQLGPALRDGLDVGLMKNRAGSTVKASAASIAAAARSSMAEIPANLLISLTDASGPDAYPITGTVWAIVYVNQPAAKARPLADFLRWATTDGQDFAESLHYARLPPELVERIGTALDKIAGKS